MRTKTSFRNVFCTVRFSADASEPTFRWRGGQGFARSLIRDSVAAALQYAESDPGAFPSIHTRRPAVFTVSVTGYPIGPEALRGLLSLIERAAGAPGTDVTEQVGSVSIGVRWLAEKAQGLDIVAPDVADVQDGKRGRTGVTDFSSDAESRLRGFAKRFLPQASKQDIKELESILRDAQAHAPRDKAAFTENINTLLDVLSIRLKTEDGHTGRLKLGRNGSLEITRSTGGTRGFKNATISLVGVRRVRVGNRFTELEDEKKSR